MQAAGTSQRPNGTNMYPRSPFSASAGSPPSSSFGSNGFAQGASAQSNGYSYGTSPNAERHPSVSKGAAPSLSSATSDPLTWGHDSRPAPAIMIRRLSRSISAETLSSMLIFAGDLIDTEFIRSPYPEDHGFATAVARFQSHTGAIEAQQKLHGKPNTSKETNMIVEIHSGGVMGSFERRNTIDATASRTQTSSASSGGSGHVPPGRSRFGSTFQAGEKVSPPLPTSSSAGSGEFPNPESSAHFKNLFSPQSPLANGVDERHRVSGKYTINNDAGDDETGELLKDPVAYARNGQQPSTRRSTNPQIPVTRFGSLSLNTGEESGNSSGVASPTGNGIASPRNGPPLQSPTSPMGGPNNGFSSYPTYPSVRPQYPPVNPADQNPPCNTLYVGNLPLDTSEDELKAVFSKQRGYKRLCFRTKQNGPMCFVEFEDVSFATKALNELYGHPLHNSVKGGIRLSFSKNPLGVRSGQTNGFAGPGANPAMNPHAMAPGYGGMQTTGGGNFSSVSGPPPGLGSPGGPPPPMMGGYRAPLPHQQQMDGGAGMFANPFGMPGPGPQEFAGQLGPTHPPRGGFSGGVPPALNGGTFPPNSRDGRQGGGWEYMLGR